jgi:hypothetical protein
VENKVEKDVNRGIVSARVSRNKNKNKSYSPTRRFDRSAGFGRRHVTSHVTTTLT